MALSAYAGWMIGPGLAHPGNFNPERLQQTSEMLERVHASRDDFEVPATDGVVLRGWKVRPGSPSGNWVLLFHGISDNRGGMLGVAEFLLRHRYSVVMMDGRAHGRSGGDVVTYGWKERFDTVAITQALCATEQVGHLYALGVSLGAAVALQAGAVEPRIEAVVAEDPLASLQEVAYDYAGLHISPWLGKNTVLARSHVCATQVGPRSAIRYEGCFSGKGSRAAAISRAADLRRRGSDHPMPPRSTDLPRSDRQGRTLDGSGSRARGRIWNSTTGVRGTSSHILSTLTMKHASPPRLSAVACDRN